MGYSKAQKTKTHKRIVSIASKRFRERGLAGFGIAELMKEADLTVGGFYKHFDSRDSLVAEAVNSAFSALASEIARSDKRTRALTSEQVRSDIQLIAALRPAKDKRTARSRAILA